MSMNNNQRWMGGLVLLGGGVLLAALLLKGKDEVHQQEVDPIKHPVEQVRLQNTQATAASDAVHLQPLTVDVATEKRLLEEQKRAREKAVAEQDAKSAEFLHLQQQVEADAARKAAEEYNAMNARRKSSQESSDNIPPELTPEAKAKATSQSHAVPSDADKKAAEQKKLQQQKLQNDVAQKKQAEEQKRKADADKQSKAAAEKQRLAQQTQAKEKAEAAAERKALDEKKHKVEQDKKKVELKAEQDQKKAEAEKARNILENGDKQWMVQVALAANQANADSVAAKLRAKGYKVTQSKTSKGVRIMVGPSKDRVAADSIRKKINADASLNMKSAWVIDWVPLDQR